MRLMIRAQAIVIYWFSLLVVLPAFGSSADWLHVGPLFDDYDLTLEPGHRTEALGPLFYSEEKDTRKTWALPPLLSHFQDPATDSTEFDFAYPVITYRRYGTESRLQFVQLLSFTGGQAQPEQNSRRITLFPFYFQQRSADPDRNYTAAFPFYGHIENRLFRDEIFFVMFPLYGQTRKGDVVTDNYLYPFFHLRHGEALSGWQFWPLTGYEHKDVTTRTNGFGETEIIGGHDNRFVLWPFFFKQKAGVGTDNPQTQQMLLPFYSFLRSPRRDSTTVLWPLITHVTDREQKYRAWETPWPLIVFARGEGNTTSRVWPFFSHAQNTNLESDWYLWPVYKFNRVHADALDRKRTRILMFLYSDTIQKNTETGAAQRRRDFWPFFTHWRDFNGSSRLQVLSILEPFLPNSKSVERDYSPVWSIWRSENNPRTGAASQSLLWNLCRRDTAPASKKCSLLFGLFQYQSNIEGKRVRLFYVPVLDTSPGAGADAK
jgi:hypothetical protein